MMGYDAGFLSREEVEIFAQAGIKPPSWQQTASTAPFTILRTTAGDKVGVLRFPSLPPNEGKPDKQLIDRLSRDIRRYRKKVRLLIGLSDWGWLGEQEYFTANPEWTPDFLLGSGRGSGVSGRLKVDDQCVWVRTYDKGRSIAEITIYEWPDRKNLFAWNPNGNYKTTSIGLNDSIRDLPAISAVVQ